MMCTYLSDAMTKTLMAESYTLISAMLLRLKITLLQVLSKKDQLIIFSMATAEPITSSVRQGIFILTLLGFTLQLRKVLNS